jgi:rubrerythrin
MNSLRQRLYPFIGNGDNFYEYKICDKCGILYDKNNFDTCPGCQVKTLEEVREIMQGRISDVMAG